VQVRHGPHLSLTMPFGGVSIYRVQPGGENFDVFLFFFCFLFVMRLNDKVCERQGCF